jgi:hypothetical protein
LLADSVIIARRLYDAAANHATHGEPLFLDIPECNPEAKALLAMLGPAPMFETARMYTGPDPAMELPKLFGVTTFELG